MKSTTTVSEEEIADLVASEIEAKLAGAAPFGDGHGLHIKILSQKYDPKTKSVAVEWERDWK